MAKWMADLTGIDKDNLDDDRVDPGWYFATLVAEAEDEKDSAELLTFKITGPLFMGKTCVKKMNNPGLAGEEKKAYEQAKQARIVARRLGLIRDEDAGKGEVEIDWSKAIGWKGVIEMEPHSFENERGKTVHMARMGYPGMYPLDHEKIPVAVRESLGLPLLPGQTASGQPKPEKAQKGQKAAPAANKAAPAAAPAKPLFDPSEI